MSAHPSSAIRQVIAQSDDGTVAVHPQTTRDLVRNATRAAAWRTVWHAAQYALFPVLVFATWWAVSAREVLPSNVLPGPGAVFDAFISLLQSGELADQLGITLWRMIRGAALGLSGGLVFGFALGLSPAIESWFGPSFRVLAQIPSIALIPLLMLVLGIDDALKLFIMVKACVIPLALLTSDGIRNIPASQMEVCAVLRLSCTTRYRRVIFPAALPSIFSGLRQGLAQVWVALLAVEMMTSADGIGYLMTWSRQLFQLDVVLVCIVVIGVVGFLLDLGVRQLEARLAGWQEPRV